MPVLNLVVSIFGHGQSFRAVLGRLQPETPGRKEGIAARQGALLSFIASSIVAVFAGITTELLSNAGARIAALDMKWPAAEPSRIMRRVSNDEGVEQVFADIIQHFGRLDGVATCAGVNNIDSFDQLDAAMFRRMHEVNVIGTFNCLKSAAARMKEGGRMVTVSSIAGIRGGGIFGTGAYAASKAAVIALTKNAARSLGPKGIVVNCVAPGPTDTPINNAMEADSSIRTRLDETIAIGRFAQPSEIGEAIVWLLSEKASYVNGATLVVDGGLTMT